MDVLRQLLFVNQLLNTLRIVSVQEGANDIEMGINSLFPQTFQNGHLGFVVAIGEHHARTEEVDAPLSHPRDAFFRMPRNVDGLDAAIEDVGRTPQKVFYAHRILGDIDGEVIDDGEEEAQIDTMEMLEEGGMLLFVRTLMKIGGQVVDLPYHFLAYKGRQHRVKSIVVYVHDIGFAHPFA